MEDQQELYQLHRFRLFKPDDLTSVNCLTINEDESKLAVLRRGVSQSADKRAVAHGLIEIWNIKSGDLNFLEQKIFENDENPGMLESIAWGKSDRLFSCGLSGHLNEYDLRAAKVKQSYALSGPAWCLGFDRSKTLAAVGTEQGHVSIFRLGDGLLEDAVNFETTLSKSDARILCLQWFRNMGTNYIVTGSIGVVKMWNYQTRQCLDVIKVGDATTAVWCVTVLDNFTIVTGDSTGTTSFWDGKSSTLISSFTSHKADVLCVCHDDDNVTYAAGVDPIIVQFRRTNSGTFTSVREFDLHTHDVRAVTITTNKWLYSGGLDVQLRRVSLDPQCDFVPISHFVDLCDHVHVTKDLIMLQYRNKLVLWQLGHANRVDLLEVEEDGSLPLSRNLSKKVELNVKNAILTSACSQRWIVCSTFSKFKVFRYTTEKIEKVPFYFDQSDEVVEKIVFCDEDRVLVSTGSILSIVKLGECGHLIESKLELKHRIDALCVSPSMFGFSQQKSINVYDAHDQKALAEVRCPNRVLCMSFNTENSELWCFTDKRKLLRLCIKRQKIEKSQFIAMLDPWFVPKEILFDDSSAFLYGENLIVSLQEGRNKHKVCKRYKFVIKVGLLPCRGREMVVVELTEEQLLKNLPPRLYKKKFGT